jgi:hypothetical protein
MIQPAPSVARYIHEMTDGLHKRQSPVGCFNAISHVTDHLFAPKVATGGSTLSPILFCRSIYRLQLDINVVG